MGTLGKGVNRGVDCSETLDSSKTIRFGGEKNLKADQKFSCFLTLVP